MAKTALSGFSVLQAQRAVHEIGLGQPPSSQINLRLFIQLQAHRKPLLTCSRSYTPLCHSISVYVLICLSISPRILPCSSIIPHVLPHPPPPCFLEILYFSVRVQIWVISCNFFPVNAGLSTHSLHHPLSAVVPRLVVFFFPACEGLTMLVKLHKAQMRRME